MNPGASKDAAAWVTALGLIPHPEGGCFRETYRSPEALAAGALPGRFGASRALSTAIYYLLRAGEHSHLHRLHADEVWHLYEGGPLHLHVLTPAGEYQLLRLGRDVDRGETFQCVVPNGCWFGAEPGEGASFALVGCTVAPGFDFADFEMGTREQLLAAFPQHRELVTRFTSPEGL
jgi:predicted cupin superfamily sugar epimerase